MIKLYENGIYLVNGETICSCPEEVAQKSGRATTKEEATKGTMTYGILQAHNQSDDPDALRLKFDSMNQPRHHLCRHHPDGPRFRPEAVSHPLCPDQLPQQPVRCGRHHQRG